MESSQPDKKRLAVLSLAALGVVYGDIGTSPLYALKEVFASTHHPVPITPENVLGILSLIFWSLIIVTLRRSRSSERGQSHSALK